jgi:3-oxoacyl-[acyl-carrier protein] reductase
MFTQNNNIVDAMLQSVCQATETNLKLQQDIMLGWTRFMPGFTGRPVSPPGKPGQNDLSETFFRIAQAQCDLMNQQFGNAMAVFDAATGGVQNGGTPATAAQPPAKAATPAPAPPKAEPAKAKAVPVAPAVSDLPELAPPQYSNIREKVAVVTGAASGIGAAVAKELAVRGAKAVLLIDRSEGVQDLAKSINESMGRKVAEAKVGDTTDEAFRKRVFNDAAEDYGVVSIVVPAAGITRDALSVRMNKETGKAEIYPMETFRQVTEVNLIAPIYWGIEMVARIAEDRKQRGLKRWEPEELIQGMVVFLGSVSSQGNKGQISYAVAKAGLEGAAATLTKEAIFHGVRCGIIHPGFTDTPMAKALGQDFLDKHVLPYTQLRRLIRVDEIADAICFMINNSAVSGELWADAGWHPPA